MKKLLSLVLLMALGFAMHAQTLNFYENFEQGSGQWTMNGTWLIADEGFFVTANNAIYSEAANATTSNMLVSPKFTYNSSDANDYELSFYIGSLCADGASAVYDLNVIIDAETQNQNVVPLADDRIASNGFYEKRTLNIGALMSALELTGSHTFNFRIDHVASNGGYAALFVDDFSIIKKGTRVIHFASNEADGTMPIVTVNNNGSYTAPQCAFTYPDHVFYNWLVVAGEMIEPAYAGATTISGIDTNIFFYPQWLSYITFDGDGSTAGTMDSIFFFPGDTVIVPECNFTKQGSKFIFWYASDEDGEYYVFPTDTVFLTESMVFTAVWADSLTIKFDANGGEGSMGDSIVTEFECLILPQPLFTNVQGTFMYWCTKADGSGDQALPGDTVMFDESETLYAIWKYASDVTVHFLSADPYVIGSMVDWPVNPGQIYDVPECAFYDLNVYFLGWFSTVSRQNFLPGGEYRTDVNDTLVAVFYYSIGFYPGFEADGVEPFEGKVTSDESRPYIVSDTFAMPECPFVRDGYTFVGWQLYWGDETDTILPGTKLQVPYSLDFVAVWKQGSNPNPPTPPTPQGCEHAYAPGISKTVCDSYSWYENVNVTASGTYTHRVANAVEQGCDSIYTLYLTVNHGTHNVEVVTSCGSYEWHGQTYDASGSKYTFAYTNDKDCPSVDTLKLTIGSAYEKTITKEACIKFSWRGNDYTTSGQYEDHVAASGSACDSTFKLNLSIYHDEYDTIHQTANGSFNWEGNKYTENGIYKAKTGTTAHGCDKYTVLNLTITGINDINTVDISLYPNPVHNTLNITGVSVLHVDVLDLTGRVVRSVEGNSLVDFHDLSNGVYMIRINAVEGNAVRRVIKK